jgi:hypothetical protein
MICKKHEQLNLVYFVGANQPLIEYVLDIPEINSVPQSENYSNIFNFTTTLYDIHNNNVGVIIGNNIGTKISSSQNLENNNYIILLPHGTMSFGFNKVSDNITNFFIGGQVINLNFLYGSDEYQNAKVKCARLLPVNDPNQTRILTIEFDD